MKMLFKSLVNQMKIDNFSNLAYVELLAYVDLLTFFKSLVNQMKIDNFSNLAYVELLAYVDLLTFWPQKQ